MKITVGQSYQDGWGATHTIVEPIEGKPGQFWSDTGYRWMEDGRMHMRVTPDRTRFDLIFPEVPTTPVDSIDMTPTSARVPAQEPHG